MPNISAARQTKRKLLSNVAHSVMLYGAPVWSDKMSAAGWADLLKVQRRICLRVAAAYCTTSREAVLVITGIPPLYLLAKERRQQHEKKKNKQTQPHENILDTWQTEWDNCKNGRWTHTLIPRIGPWINRRHGETNFHLTQALSGHGCFAADLKRFGKLDSPECWFCDDPNDDAEHTIFRCDAFNGRRREAETELETDLNPESLIQTMLVSKSNWDVISGMIGQIMRKKETEERRRQANQ